MGEPDASKPAQSIGPQTLMREPCPLGACQPPRKGWVSVGRRATRLNQDAAGPILVIVLGMVAGMECTFIRKWRQASIQAAKAMAKELAGGGLPAAPDAS